MTTEALTIDTIAAHVVNAATMNDLDTLIAAVKTRRTALNALNAMAVTADSEIELSGLSPQYLNGLTGTVKPGRRGQRVDILLTEASTSRLRRSGRKYFIPADTERFILTGVPAACCTITGKATA